MYLELFFYFIDMTQESLYLAVDLELFFLLYRYDMGKSLLDSVFGSKLHPDFPRKFRLDTHGCRGKGFYPSRLYSGEREYWSRGVDLEISEGETVCSSLL